MQKNISTHHRKIERQRLASGMLIIGVGLVLVSAVISVLFIRPTNFKSEYQKRKLNDCLKTATNPVICQQKFGN